MRSVSPFLIAAYSQAERLAMAAVAVTLVSPVLLYQELLQVLCAQGLTEPM